MKTLTGFISEAMWHHGSPDIRDIKDKGFEQRTHNVFNHVSKEDETVPKPVFFTNNLATARTYADERRAFDYQNAQGGITSMDISTHDALKVNAGGVDFHSIPHDAVKEALPQERHDEFDHLAKSYSHMAYKKIISTDQLATVAHKMGYDKLHITNVIDDYSAKNRPTSVLAFFPKRD